MPVLETVMTPRSILHDVPGGKALVEWFGRVPRFHDAELLELSFSSKGAGLLRIHAWNTTNEVDAQGYFVRDQHAVVTLALERVTTINCADFDVVPGIIFSLEITRTNEQFHVEWSASYGVTGFVTAKQVRIILEQGEPKSGRVEPGA